MIAASHVLPKLCAKSVIQGSLRRGEVYNLCRPSLQSKRLIVVGDSINLDECLGQSSFAIITNGNALFDEGYTKADISTEGKTKMAIHGASDIGSPIRAGSQPHSSISPNTS